VVTVLESSLQPRLQGVQVFVFTFFVMLFCEKKHEVDAGWRSIGGALFSSFQILRLAFSSGN
jgi:hypothetical protein